jgi:predicted RNA-binding protein
MAFLYTIVKNQLSTIGNLVYVAKTIWGESISLDRLKKELSYGSTLTKADVEAFMENLDRVLVKFLQEGYSVDLGFCILKPQIKGVFKNQEDSFDSSRNWVTVNMTPKRSFVDRVTISPKTKKVNLTRTAPILREIQNLHRESSFEFKLSDFFLLKGENLKFDSTDLEVGVFFKLEELELRAKGILESKKTSVKFTTPDGLEVDKEYTILVKTKQGEKIKTGELEYKLRLIQ